MPSTKTKMLNLDDLEPQKILKILIKQKAEGIFCDVKLCMQGTVTWGHACVLAPLSSYIMDHFRPSSDTNHWCSQRPLVIDLDIVITVDEDKCALCLSTLVDFMYSQNLVILDGHLQHFSKMIYYLQIVDLFPLFNTNTYDGNIATLSKEPNVKAISVDSRHIPDNELLKEDENDKPGKCLTTMPKINHLTNSSLSNISKITNSYQEPPDKKQKLIMPPELNQSCNITERISSCTENGNVSLALQNCKVNENADVFVEEHSYASKGVTTLHQTCELLCCTDEEVSAGPSTNHKRKISCEMCSFTTVSIKRFLNHIESEISHLGTMCPVCTQQFQSTGYLKQHLKDHNNYKPYLCQFCSKRSRFWEFYKRHLKVHCRKKRFNCEICYRSFTNQPNLKVHLKKHKTNYFCSHCMYLTSDAGDFKAHLLIHEEKAVSAVTSDSQHSHGKLMPISDNDLVKYKTTKQFLCCFCGKGFTQKSNLKRHIELEHSNVLNINCCECNYVTNRTDLLKTHMKKHHNSLPKEVNRPSERVTETVSKKQKLDKDQTEVVGVMIPVQLMSTNDSSTLNVFAVKTSQSLVSESVKKTKLDGNVSSLTTNISGISVHKKHLLSSNLVENKFTSYDNCETNINDSLETLNPVPRLISYRDEKNSSNSLLRNNEARLENNFTGEVQNIDGSVTNLQLQLNAGNLSCNKTLDRTQPVVNISHEFNDSQIALEEGNTNLKNIQVVESDLKTRCGEFWLNEATGEFLNSNGLVNLQVIDASCKFKTVSTSAENPQEDTIDPLMILSDNSKTVSILDLMDEVDDFKSNPQTPQTNLFEVDGPDNLFPWNCIDNKFCSTLVLNETTGELNMVSFNVQPIKHSDESKLDENTGIFSPKDDDETALFLNEGTGDLSVIYFNPSKRECDSSIHLSSEQGVQDVPDNVSEHSNNEDDFLNAEFFKATASFMAHKENEIFLNELTGEFDTNVADFNNYHPDLFDNQLSFSESYLNEETGEILGNVLNKNVGSDFFTNSESFKYDLDDSLNCDDFEPFADGINDFSSQFCLETAQDWQSVDETCDTLLNECTGELVKKS